VPRDRGGENKTLGKENISGGIYKRIEFLNQNGKCFATLLLSGDATGSIMIPLLVGNEIAPIDLAAIWTRRIIRSRRGKKIPFHGKGLHMENNLE
jgi:hypothetical protein